MKKKGFAIIIGSALICLSACAAALGGNGRTKETSNEEPAAVLSISGQEEPSDTRPGFVTLSSDTLTETDSDPTPSFSYDNVADVAEAVMPSIVAITNKSVQEVNSFFYGHSFQYESESAGSGIIIGSNDTELLVCTNNHVVEDANELSVTFIDENSYTAFVKGTDPDNDLAVVAVKLEDISSDTMDAIKIARTGDSDTMRIGEQVVAIGNALGYGQSVTTGIISAKNRSITASSEGSGNATTYDDLIQTDAAINFGNSGGALLNMNGEVIGINSAKASSYSAEGMGYSIPISKALPILEDLMSRQTRVKLPEEQIGYMGINGQSVSRDATLLYGIPEGIYVTYVDPEGPAAAAGIQEGDIIMKFDGESVRSMTDLQYLLQYYSAGESVKIDLQTSSQGPYRDASVNIVLGSRSALQS